MRFPRKTHFFLNLSMFLFPPLCSKKKPPEGGKRSFFCERLRRWFFVAMERLDVNRDLVGDDSE